MVTSSKVDAALDALAQYREEGVVLQSALDDLRAQPAALDRLIGRLDSSRPDALVDGFVALRQHFAHTRAQIDVAIDFLDKAVEELGGSPPYDGKAADHRELAEEGP
ncbi:MAG TPA: hypothetical protein VGL23_04820 [Chloroflexota bacterium]|jgi:hypothetical protein